MKLVSIGTAKSFKPQISLSYITLKITTNNYYKSFDRYPSFQVCHDIAGQFAY